MKIGLIIIGAGLGAILSGVAFTEEIPPGQKAEALEAIRTCESFFSKVSPNFPLAIPSKSGSLASSTKKKRYERLVTGKRAYDEQYSELVKFTNMKIQVRMAKTREEMNKVLPEYKRNCNSLGENLPKFVIWVDKGTTGSKTYDTIFQEWYDDAK